MGDAAEDLRIEYATYLSMEAASEAKHEWFDGRVYAMAGGTLAHSALAAAVLGELRALLRDRGCVTYSADARVRVAATGLATYPDGAVVCGPAERDAADRHALINPAIVVEVLSDGTEMYDRGEKFAHYRQLASLCDYLLVSQHEPRIEIFSRDGDRWIYAAANAGERVVLSAMEGAIDVDRVYAGIALEPRVTRWSVGT